MPDLFNTSEYRTPGQLIKDRLEELGWTQRVLAIVLGMDEGGINKIISGKRPLDASNAIAIGDVLGIEPAKLMAIQADYSLKQAELIERPDPGRATRAKLFGSLPIADMIKRGWLDAENMRDVPKVESALTKFFGCESAEEIEILPHAAKKTNVNTPATPAQLAWLYRVRQIAAEMIVPPYTLKKGQSAVTKLRALRVSADAVRKVPRILMESGIRFVIVESLPGAKIDGVCFWLNERSPVIGMTLRFDRLDNFWFVLRHELEHVIQGHGREQMMLDAELEGENAGSGADIPEEERVANEAASNFCVPEKNMQSFIKRKAPLFSERDLLGFSRSLEIHPGIVVGQLQHKTGRYEIFRKYLTNVREKVAPSAYIDGWGEIHPVEN
ncbi:HTH-type transcriptional regulator/antitoxin HigA [Haloferula luteola]|uniref:HTH-type transcriptional regulator/antitoxin HigA n=1 Tax=Haloferula luteola TaxID=595692 RepID=A0A840VC52_9BACT|nr:helix-turn-helix domain-containing protein [Haloferula luteola]MBB5351389.1 HTH-type transcriptional regulator/antitoxin HigA [Haloferula luteola]